MSKRPNNYCSQYHDSILSLAMDNTITTISKILDIPTSTLAAYCKVNNIEPVARNTPSVEETNLVTKISELIDGGATRKEIAEKLNTSVRKVKYLMSKYGLVTKDREFAKRTNSQPAEDIKEIVAFKYQCGTTIKKLSEDYNISIPTVLKITKQYSVFGKERKANRTVPTGYYVYIHKRLDDLSVFYVGKGKGLRLYQRRTNNKRWVEIVDSVGYYPEVLQEGLTEEEALDLEYETMLKYSESIINERKPSKVLEIPEDIGQYIRYDETSSTFLRWSCDTTDSLGRRIQRKDKEAGYFNKINGYLKVRFRGNNYAVHRVICYLHGMNLSGKIVDHLDGNPKNNNISNLNPSTYTENARNCKLSSKNTSGQNGVSCDDNICYGYYINHEGKLITKTFSYGKIRTKDEAITLCKEFREKAISENPSLNFSERHGKDKNNVYDGY